jgi:hypothetical protein
MMSWIVALFLIFGPWSMAEYRAYELTIVDNEKGTSRTVTSVLDHLQYQEFHSVRRNEVVSLSNTWRCRGNTSGYKPICPKPATE